MLKRWLNGCLRAAIQLGICLLLQMGAVTTSWADNSVEFHGYAPQIWRGMEDSSGLVSFKGLPFAAPPVGQRRWQAPAAYQPVAGSADARAFAPACMQGPHTVNWYQSLIRSLGQDPSLFTHPIQGYSEDCLYLNIWTPQMRATTKLPVMVWIHGGSNKGGWPYEPDYHGDALARQGVVVVSVPYRMGIFGFFSHPQLQQHKAANYGLMDLLAALQWIQDHIAEFGGDPHNVTVFGESAGAANIGYLMSSPAAQGLFHKAIHQSAGFQMVESALLSDLTDTGKKLSAATELNLQDLRELDSSTILAEVERHLPGLSYAPAVGGQVLPRAPAEVFAAGQHAHVPLMIGTNANEWLMYLQPDESLADVLRTLGLQEQAALVRQHMPGVSVHLQQDRLYSAQQMRCPSYQLASAVSQQTAAWVYHFSHVREGAYLQSVGAYHGAEIPYIFATHANWLNTNDVDHAVTRVMQSYWVNFARSGNPNGPGLPAWRGWRTGAPAVMELQEVAQMIDPPDMWLCRILADRVNSQSGIQHDG